MAAGGIHDQLGGGFARYSVDAGWIVPHFEKMLYDNALLARTYLRAWQELGHERYRDVCTGILRLGAARDAGARGRLLLRARRRLRGRGGPLLHLDPGRGPRRARGGRPRSRARALLAHLGITPGGQLEGRSVLHLPRRRRRAEPPPGLDAAKAALLARSRDAGPARARRQAALRLERADDGRAGGGRRGARRAPLRRCRARDCAEFVLAEMRDARRAPAAHLQRRRAHLNAYLEDHAYLLEALLDSLRGDVRDRWSRSRAARSRTR